MLSRAKSAILRDESGAIAPTFALSLFALIAVGGIAFDYARLAAMDSELQNAADQAALAAASQLDGEEGATQRAVNAANTLVSNDTRFANDGVDADSDNNIADVTIATVTFYETKDLTDEVVRDDASADDDKLARFVEVTVGARTAKYALTPIVGALKSDAIDAAAVAGLGSAICKVPPVMICNPAEPLNNTDEDLDYNPITGTGLKLVTGNATVPGNFGWLESSIGNGAPALAAALGQDTPPGICQPTSGVTTKTGMDAVVLNAFNTRFDIYANGNLTCPNIGGGACSPSSNTRKDLVCNSTNGTTCSNDNWNESNSPYRPESPSYLPSDGTGDPDIMGYPRDLCHAVKEGAQCGISGNGDWDRDAFFRVNYNWATSSAWQAGTKSIVPTGPSGTVTRYDVYNWELNNRTANSRGIDIPQLLTGNKAGFGSPATGRPGIIPGGEFVDRRRLSVAVLNCRALVVKGKTVGASVVKWLEVFLTEPAFSRVGGKGKDKDKFTDQKDIYVEVIGETTSGESGATAGQVVRRDVPYLVK